MPLLSESQCFDFNIFFLKQTLLQVTLKVSGEKNAQTGLKKKKNRGEQLCMLSSQIITSHSDHSIIVWIQEVIEKPKKKRA